MAKKKPKVKRTKAADTPSIVPKGAWVKWSGRHWKVLDEQAQRYGIPLLGEKVDLAAVAVWIHELLANKGRQILASDAAEEIWDDEQAPASPALERTREVKYQLMLRDLAERDGQLVSRAAAHQCFAAAAAIFKTYGDTVQKKYGADALDLWNQTLTGWQRAVDEVFAQEGEK